MIGQKGGKGDGRNFRRELRNGLTDAERVLWRALRGRQLFGVKFRRQHDFKGYTLDFVCLERKLVVELDGSQHAAQVVYDDKRTEELARAGYHVIRFWNNEVFNNIEGVKETIYKKILELQPHPHPDPPLEREGELHPDGGPSIMGGEMQSDVKRTT